jgi:cyclopropane-fatty-acyl-phospholipid synthase
MTEAAASRSELEPARRSGRSGAADLGLFGEFGGLGVQVASVLGHRLGRRVRGGSIVLGEQGSVRTLGAGRPEVHVELHDERAYAALLGRGSVGLGESYLAGWWDADDLTALVRILFRSTEGLRHALDGAGRALSPVTSPVRSLRAPSKHADRRNVQAHYDLPGELFELMLDDTMAYSCAVFDRPGMTLEEAQGAKFDRLCQKLRLTPDDRLLEIGTGWGGLAIHAASRYGCRVTTTTISDAQREVAAGRVTEAGLADRVTVLGLDYRDLPRGGRFDKLVSVEMIEAVDWRRHDTFFRACSEQLTAGGLMALQAITIDDRSYERAKHHDDFVRRMVFPGGCIPSLEAIARSVARATDLTVIDVEDIGRHYAETLRRWRQNLDAHRAELTEAGYEARFRRLWELYLSYCEAAFLERHISDAQIVLAKPRWAGELSVRTV